MTIFLDGMDTAVASVQTTDDGCHLSVKKLDDISLRVVSAIDAMPVTPCLMFWEGFGLLVGPCHVCLLTVVNWTKYGTV